MGLRCVLSILSASYFAVAGACAGNAGARDKPPVEIVPQTGHAGAILQVAFSPDGQFALSGSDDKTLKLWEIATGKELRSFAGHADTVSSVAFSPDGRFALSGSYDKTLKLWEVATGRPLRTFSGHRLGVDTVAFSPDGRLGLSGSEDGTLRLWEAATGKELRKFSSDGGIVSSVAFSPDGRFALSNSGFDFTVKVWEVATGKLLRSFSGHKDSVSSVAFSPDGRLALSSGCGKDKTGRCIEGIMKLWEAATGKELRSFSGHTDQIESAVFSPDGRFVLSGSSDKTLKLWDVATGKELRSFSGHDGPVESVAFSPDGKRLLSGGWDSAFKLWELATGEELRSFGGHTDQMESVAFSPDGRLALTGSGDKTLKLWDTATGKMLRSFSGHESIVTSVAFSPDGRFALSGSCGAKGENGFCSKGMMKLWEVAAGKEVRSFSGHTRDIVSVAFSPDGKSALSGSLDYTLKLWEVATGSELRTFSGHALGVNSGAFSPDGRFALSAGDDATLKLWDVASAKELRSFRGPIAHVKSIAFSPDGRFALSGSGDNTLSLWDLNTGNELRRFTGHKSAITSVGYSPDGRFALSGSEDKTLKLWEAATGKELRSFKGHSGAVSSVTFSPDGRFVLSGSLDGTARLWNVEKGQELALMMATPAAEWLAFSRDGFFAASHRDTDMLAIVRGMESTAIGQVHQSLFSPDLVREALAGDPGGEVRRAAQVMNLEKVLDSGPAPQVAIVSQAGATQSADLVTVAARITDRGAGIGRVEWRVNGVTASVTGAPAGTKVDYEAQQALALDPGENKIEIVAYNARNLLASPPARTTINFTGPNDRAKPKLYVLAIGINAYADAGWTPPGTTERVLFPPLNLAVADARAFAAAMRQAGAGLYSEVRVIEALDSGATAEALGRTFERISSEINPRDTFVLYAAAHGISERGRFYLIPQDYQGGNNPEALASRAIGQDRLQSWIANRIKARKAIILLDTCESGALVNGYTKSRTDAPASEAAVGRLHEATGRPVLTAAASGKPAFEGYNGHGVFTWALIEALHNGDSNGDGMIELSELTSYVQDLVPKLAASLNGRGAAATAMRGFADDKQSAHFGSTGEDFAIVRRLP